MVLGKFWGRECTLSVFLIHLALSYIWDLISFHLTCEFIVKIGLFGLPIYISAWLKTKRGGMWKKGWSYILSLETCTLAFLSTLGSATFINEFTKKVQTQENCSFFNYNFFSPRFAHLYGKFFSLLFIPKIQWEKRVVGVVVATTNPRFIEVKVAHYLLSMFSPP